MLNLNTNFIAGIAGVFGALTYLLFFLLLLSANIALWKYIVTKRGKNYGHDRDVDKKERR